MVFGTFDIVHLGHIHVFKEAKKHGDSLVVVIARDQNTSMVKGTAPFHTEKERLEFIQELQIVDKAVLGDNKDPYKVILTHKPEVIALGYDQTQFVDKLEAFIKEHLPETKIVRIEGHNVHKHKSSIIKSFFLNT